MCPNTLLRYFLAIIVGLGCSGLLRSFRFVVCPLEVDVLGFGDTKGSISKLDIEASFQPVDWCKNPQAFPWSDNSEFQSPFSSLDR